MRTSVVLVPLIVPVILSPKDPTAWCGFDPEESVRDRLAARHVRRIVGVSNKYAHMHLPVASRPSIGLLLSLAPCTAASIDAGGHWDNVRHNVHALFDTRLKLCVRVAKLVCNEPFVQRRMFSRCKMRPVLTCIGVVGRARLWRVYRLVGGECAICRHPGCCGLGCHPVS